MPSQLYCTFYLAGNYLGVEVSRVQEIIRYQQMRRVPLAHPVVQGLINLRGQIVTAINLSRRMEIEEQVKNHEPVNVVCRQGDESTSLLVDEIGDVIEVQDELYEECPDTIQGSWKEFIKGAYKLSDKLLLVLDTEKVINI